REGDGRESFARTLLSFQGRRDRLAAADGRRLPELHDPVAAEAGERLAVRREGHHQNAHGHLVRFHGRVGNLFWGKIFCLEVGAEPDGHGAVVVAGGHGPVRGEGARQDGAVRLQLQRVLFRGRGGVPVPQPYQPVVVGGRDPAAV